MAQYSVGQHRSRGLDRPRHLSKSASELFEKKTLCLCPKGPRYPPPVGADVLGRPQPGPPGGRPLPRTIENLGRPQPPHNAISFDCGCGPPRTSAPTDSLTFHSSAATNRIGRALRATKSPAWKGQTGRNSSASPFTASHHPPRATGRTRGCNAADQMAARVGLEPHH